VGVVVAEHVMLVDGRICTWDDLLSELQNLRREGSRRLKLNFRLTTGAVETLREQKLHADVAAIDPALVRPDDIRVGRMYPYSSTRFDAVQTEADLLPRPEQMRRGVVKTAAGRPVRKGVVLLIPTDFHRMAPIPTPEWVQENDLDEIWTNIDPEGRFEIAAPTPRFSLAVVTPLGFAFAPLPEPGTEAHLTLLPSSVLKVDSTEGVIQRISMIVKPDGLPREFPGFGIIDYELGGKPREERFPAGSVAILHMQALDTGVIQLVQATELTLKAGERQEVVIHPLEDPAPEEK
jgi:hypothetical protein